MKPVLIHIHLFYHDMWPELEQHLRSLPPELPSRLYVTLAEHREETEARILNFDPRAQIILTENRGFDVGPFVQVLNGVNLDDFSLVIKLHSKRDMPAGSRIGHVNLGGDRWRKLLLAFLQPAAFRRVLRAFEQDARLGMTGHNALIFRRCLHDCVYNQSAELLKKVGLPVKDFAYIIGTMFLCRATLLKPIQQMGFTIQDFEPPDRRHPEALAYTLEALLCWVITAQGYKLRDCFTPFPRLQTAFSIVKDGVLRFLYRQKKTSSGRLIIKVCGVPVFISRKHSL